MIEFIYFNKSLGMNHWKTLPHTYLLPLSLGTNELVLPVPNNELMNRLSLLTVQLYPPTMI